MENWIKVCFIIFYMPCSVWSSPLVVDATSLAATRRVFARQALGAWQLSFKVCVSSEAGCGDGLSTQQLPVDVEFRTVAANLTVGEWLPLGNFTIDAGLVGSDDVYSSYSFSLGPVDDVDPDLFQFRIIQREHAGGGCNCWRLKDVESSVLASNTPRFVSLTGVCGVSGAYTTPGPAVTFEDIDFCMLPANIPRSVESLPLSDSLTQNKNCPPDNSITDPPICTDSSQPPYLNVTFQLHINNQGNSGCDPSDRLDEGVELSFRNTPGGDWIPAMYFFSPPRNTANSIIGDYDYTNNTISIRGYRVSVWNVTMPSPIDVTILLCGVESGVQLRWLQSVRSGPGLSARDVWALDNVVISYTEVSVFEDDFSCSDPSPDCWLPARNGQISNGTVACLPDSNGQAFVFGLAASNFSFDSRMVITTPLDLNGGTTAPTPTSTPVSTVSTSTVVSTSTPISTTIISTPTSAAESSFTPTSTTGSSVSTSTPTSTVRMSVTSTAPVQTNPPAPTDPVIVIEAQILSQIQGNEAFAALLEMPAVDALESFEQLLSSGETIDSTVAVYLLGGILQNLPPGEPVPVNVSKVFLLVVNNILEQSVTTSGGDDVTMGVAGSSLLQIMETFLFTFHDFDNDDGSELGTDQVELRAFTESSDDDSDDDDVVGINFEGHEVILSRDLIRALNSNPVQVGSLFYRNMSGLLPGDIDDRNGSILASPVLATSVQCPMRDCPIPPGLLAPPVRIIIQHSRDVMAMITRSGGSTMEVLCVFWEFDDDSGGVLSSGAWSQEGCWRNEALSSATQTVCECTHLTNFAILLSPTALNFTEAERISLQVIGTIGTAMSIVAMAITAATFILFRSLWSMRNYIHVHLCVNLSIAQLVFVVGVTPVPGDSGVSTGCRAVAVLLHYFFLVSFMWMLMEGVVLYVALVRVFVTNKLRYIIAFTLTSYGVPLLYLGITLPLGFALRSPPDYGYEDACWLNPATHFVWSFIAPVMVIILVNIGFFIMAMVIACKHRRNNAHKTRIATAIHWIKAAISLLLVMGITWIVGVLVLQEDALKPLAFIFTILFAFQGVFIFVIFVLLDKKVREVYSKWWKVNVSKWWKAKMANSEFLIKHFGDKSFATTVQTVSTNVATMEKERKSQTVNTMEREAMAMELSVVDKQMVEKEVFANPEARSATPTDEGELSPAPHHPPLGQQDRNDIHTEEGEGPKPNGHATEEITTAL